MKARITMASVRSNTDLVSFSVEKQAATGERRLRELAPPPTQKAKRQHLWKLTNDMVFQNDASR